MILQFLFRQQRSAQLRPTITIRRRTYTSLSPSFSHSSPCRRCRLFSLPNNERQRLNTLRSFSQHSHSNHRKERYRQIALDYLKENGIEVDVKAFERDGCGVVRNFASPAECRGMRERMKELIENWDPNADLTTFRTDGKQVNSFLNIHTFYLISVQSQTG